MATHIMTLTLLRPTAVVILQMQPRCTVPGKVEELQHPEIVLQTIDAVILHKGYEM